MPAYHYLSARLYKFGFVQRMGDFAEYEEIGFLEVRPAFSRNFTIIPIIPQSNGIFAVTPTTSRQLTLRIRDRINPFTVLANQILQPINRFRSRGC